MLSRANNQMVMIDARPSAPRTRFTSQMQRFSQYASLRIIDSLGSSCTRVRTSSDPLRYRTKFVFHSKNIRSHDPADFMADLIADSKSKSFLVIRYLFRNRISVSIENSEVYAQAALTFFRLAKWPYENPWTISAQAPKE